MDDFLVERVPASKKAAFARLFQRYLREHAPFTGKRPIDGVYQYPWLDLYWREQGARWPFWMRTIGDLAALDADDRGPRRVRRGAFAAGRRGGAYRDAFHRLNIPAAARAQVM